MDRKSLDKLISSTGLLLAIVLLGVFGGLLYTSNFIHSQVHEQLERQKITFPAVGSESLANLPDADKKAVAKYAGEQLVTGAQAKVFADNYIAVHIEKVAEGKTYAEVSSLALANPKDTKLTAQTQTLFRGETLRGLLLNAYAFDTMAVVAQYAAYGALAASLLLFVLSGLGFHHAGMASASSKKRR